MLRAWQRRSPVALDVGANRGQTVRSLRLVLDRPTIHCVEPNPHLASYLSRRRLASSVTAAAMSDAPGELELFLPRYGHTVYDTRASLDENEARAFLSPQFFARFSGRRAGVERHVVPVVTLDEFADRRPDLVKLDVEGVDHLVVAGGETMLSALTPLLLVERPHAETTSRLVALGYRPHAYDPGSRALVAESHGVLNTFFLHTRHIGELPVVT